VSKVGDRVSSIHGSGVVTARDGYYVYVRLDNGTDIELYDCELTKA